MSRLSAVLLALALLIVVAGAALWEERAPIGRAVGLAVALRFTWARLCRHGVKDV